MQVGVNCHPTHWNHNQLPKLVQELKHLNCFGVRFPLWRGHQNQYRRFVDLCTTANIDVLPVLDNRSFTAKQLVDKNFRAGISYWKGKFPSLHRWQVGNEPDQPNSPSSWFLDKPTFQKLLNDAVAALPGDQVVAGGLVHVDFSYLDVAAAGVRRAVHPYAKDGSNVGPLLDLCVRNGAMPLCTEFGSPEADELMRGPWFSEMLIALSQTGVGQAYVYCYSKRQDGAMGIVEADGTETNSYAAVRNAIPGV